MHSLRYIGVVTLILVLSGCASFDIAEFQKDLQPILKAEFAKCPEEKGRELSSRARNADKTMVSESVPDVLSKDKAFQAVLSSFDAAQSLADGRSKARGATSPTGPAPSGGDTALSRGDFKDFVNALGKGGLLDPTAHLTGESMGRTVDGKPGLSEVFRAYYDAYIRGEFTDRFGTKLSKPEIKSGIGNDVIKGALVVFLEAMADTQLRTPLLYTLDTQKNKVYVLSPKAKPTSAQFVGELPLLADADSAKCGITEKEAKAILYLANLAADKSSLINTVLFESFGAIELSFVIGGDFAVGDNKTMAEVVKTFVESVARRGTEKLVQDFLFEYGYTAGASRASGTEGRIQAFIQKFQ